MADHSATSDHGSDHGHAHGHDHGDWFRHDADEAKPQAEHAAHVNTTAIGLTLLVLVFGVLFTVIVLTMYFVQYANTRKAMVEEGTTNAEPYRAYRDQADRDLGRFGWADRAAGVVLVPIDRAMDDVVADYARAQSSADREITPWHGPMAPAPRFTPEDTLAMERHTPHD